ncbi:MAG: hypothetical protein IT439_10015 [Phycisphaerales bacterium]|nr:hypothetical protein [Phycisphaerales bacterium]
MHTLTKIFVAAAAVLSVALATLTMAYAVNADRIVKELRAERAAKEQANASKDAAVAEYGMQRQLDEARVQDLSSRLTALQNTLVEREQSLARSEADRAVAQQAVLAGQTQIEVAQSGVKTLTEILSGQSTELAALRTSELRLRTDLREITDRFNNTEAERDVYASNLRAMTERLTELQHLLAAAGGSTAAGSNSGGSLLSAYFTGRVDEVTLDSGSNETLVRLNVGSTDSVRTDADLFVTRGAEWIANVRVVQVDLNYCVARVVVTAAGRAIQVGDTVESRLQ